MAQFKKMEGFELQAVEICLNYQNREAQLSDNYSNGGMEEFTSMIFNGDRVKAELLVRLMEAKGLGQMDEEEDIFWLSERAVNEYFDIKEGK